MEKGQILDDDGAKNDNTWYSPCSCSSASPFMDTNQQIVLFSEDKHDTM